VPAHPEPDRPPTLAALLFPGFEVLDLDGPRATCRSGCAGSHRRGGPRTGGPGPGAGDDPFAAILDAVTAQSVSPATRKPARATAPAISA
jgi:hypothetical protein